ncbi:CPBP family intramembrane glutamic endopeptidase [Aequorivita flava]|uniref:CPBP family intramembrane glutamic endopeptidase n=1 Tax=Aequorivita flava TaxID=3114371 RepID=A0AB35YR15_9FLAO
MTTIIKSESPYVKSIVILAIIALIMLMPMENLFRILTKDDFKLEYINLIFKMGLIFLIGYSMIRMLKTQALAGVSGQFSWRFKYLNLIPVYLIIIAILGLLDQNFSAIASVNLMLLLIGCFMVGFAEEYLFRGLLQSLFLKKYGLRKNGIFISILLPSVFFGAFHLLNLTKNDTIGQVLVQVVFAMFIGFFFGVLGLKTNKLNAVAITHGLINFFFSIAFLPGLKSLQEDLNNPVSMAPIILTFPLLIIAFFMYKKIDKKEIEKKIAMGN